MHSMDTCAVQNLLATGRSRRSNNGRGDIVGVLNRLADGGEEDHLADGQRGLVVFLLVAE